MDYYYKVGGSLNYNHPTYVIRKADQDLFNLLKAGEYCFVLNCRQMGKSSLKIRTAKKLRSQGFKCASIDLTLLGSQVTPESWYKGLASELLMSLELELDLNINQWWQEYNHLTEIQKIKNLLDLLLEKSSQNIVIFLDEIDTLINIPFKDDFFAFIRACYNQRSENTEYIRLNFCLLGVAAPADLIQDKERTPFNIGHSIELTGLTFSEAKEALVLGLEDIVSEPETILQQILYWSGGQPFLTQKLCSLIVQHPPNSSSDITEIVQQYIIEHWETQDEPEHLRTIRSRLLYDEPLAIRLLGLYQQILQSNHGITFTGTDEQIYLRISGLVVKRDNLLQVYNPIYKAVFNSDWVQFQLDQLRPYREILNQWLKSQQDPAYLLKGTLLLDAQQWAKERSLSDVDYQFLSQSQREQDRKEKEILSKAYKKSIKILSLTITFAILLVVGSIVYAQQRIKNAQDIIEIEKIGDKALDQFPSQQLMGLISAIEAGQQLKQLVNTKHSLTDYPTTTPISSLLTILGHIQEYNTWEGHQNRIRTVAYSPDGKIIASGSADETIKLWTTEGILIKTLSHSGEVYTVNFTPDGKMLISGSNEGTIKFWTRQGHLIKTVNHGNSIYTLAISPDGKLMASGGKDGKIKLWNQEGILVKTFTGHQGSIYTLRFSSDSQMIASGSGDRTIKLWKNDGTLIKTLSGHQGDVNSVAFSPDGKIIASGSGDKTIKLWNQNGQLIKTFTGHQDSIWTVDFNLNGSVLVSSSLDKTIKLWSVDGTLIETLAGHLGIVYGISVHPDGDSFVSSGSDHTLKLWKFSKSALASWQGHQDFISSISLSPDGKKIVSGSWDGSLKLWDSEGRLIKILTQDRNIITSVRFSPKHNLIAAVNNSGKITLWDEKGSFLKSWMAHQGIVNNVVFNADANILATAGSDDGTIKLWRKDGQLLQTFSQNQEEITSLSIDSQGKHLISSTSPGKITLYKTDGTIIKTWETNQLGITSISMSYKGEIIASAGRDGTIKLWSKKGDLISSSFENQQEVTRLEFSKDGRILITGHQDGTIKLWKTDGTLLLVLKGAKREDIGGISLSADAQTLVASSGDWISFWNLNLDQLLKRGCTWLEDYGKNQAQIESLCSL